MRSPNFATVSRLIQQGIDEASFPGAVFGVAFEGQMHTGAFGRHRYDAQSKEVTVSTQWDLASVSKVVGPTALAMQAVENGILDLDGKVVSVLPEFGQNDKDQITFRNLLAHDSGLAPYRHYEETCTSSAEIIASIYLETLINPVGSVSVYSDLNMIVLAYALEQLLGKPLDVAFHLHVALPLKLRGTGYIFRSSFERNLGQIDPENCAPTETMESWRIARHQLAGTPFSEFIQGEVHDPRAAVMEGVAGHAGLFSIAEDLLTFGQALLSGEIAAQDVVRDFTRRQSLKSSRALGWDTPSGTSSSGQFFSPSSFGHTGFTGTSLWIDPDRALVVTLLTNRVHPTSSNTKILGFRPAFHDAIMNALGLTT